MRSLMHMLFGQMITRGKGQINVGSPSSFVVDARIRTSSTVLVTFTGVPPAVASPVPFTVDVNDGSFNVIRTAPALLVPAPFDYVIKN